MLVITSIESITVNEDTYLKYNFNSKGVITNATSHEESKVTREIINGLRFINPMNNEEIVVAYSKEVEQALCYPMECIRSQIRESERSMDMRKLELSKKEKAEKKLDEQSYEIEELKNKTLFEYFKLWWSNDGRGEVI